jgi:hypothetical protein
MRPPESGQTQPKFPAKDLSTRKRPEDDRWALLRGGLEGAGELP